LPRPNTTDVASVVSLSKVESKYIPMDEFFFDLNTYRIKNVLYPKPNKKEQSIFFQSFFIFFVRFVLHRAVMFSV
jgi:hypothetical protein